jgi:translation initiation factor IF-3
MKNYSINYEINSQIIRIKDSGELISLSDALRKAVDTNTDLIELSVYIDNNKNQVSVCIFQDYQKFLYQQKKREKVLKAGQAKVIVKELRFGPQTDEHDYQFKLKHAREFINSKAKVKAYIMFKGREIMFKDQGESLLLRLTTDLEDIAKVESKPKLEGKRMNMVLIPK